MPNLTRIIDGLAYAVGILPFDRAMRISCECEDASGIYAIAEISVHDMLEDIEERGLNPEICRPFATDRAEWTQSTIDSSDLIANARDYAVDLALEDAQKAGALPGRYLVTWDNGTEACGEFPDRFLTEADARAFGEEWCQEMDLLETDPAEALDQIDPAEIESPYSFEVIDTWERHA